MRQERVGVRRKKGIGERKKRREKKGKEKKLQGNWLDLSIKTWFSPLVSSWTALAKVTMRESDKLPSNWTEYPWKQSSSAWPVIRINESPFVNNHFVFVIPSYQMLTCEHKCSPKIPQMMWYKILPLSITSHPCRDSQQNIRITLDVTDLDYTHTTPAKDL